MFDCMSLENYLEVSYAYYNMMCISEKVELQRISRWYFMQTPPTHPSSIWTYTHLSIQSHVRICMHPSLIPTIIPLPLHPSIYPSTYPIHPYIHPCVCLHLYIHIYVHASFHPPIIFLSTHPPIYHLSTYAHTLAYFLPFLQGFCHSVCPCADCLRWVRISPRLLPQEPRNLMQQTLSRYRFSIWEFRLYVSNLMTSQPAIPIAAWI